MISVFSMNGIITVLFLVFLEGLLSLDNALVLAMVVRHLPVHQQRKALTYGIWGAFLFRFIALFWLTHIMALNWVKIVGGVYLLFVAMKEAFGEDSEAKSAIPASLLTFWRIIFVVEGLDIAFSADSILAAVSVSQNYWIVMTGGILGIIMMRFAARGFVILMEKFPRLEQTACLLISLIGVKLLIQGTWPDVDFHSSRSPFGWMWGIAMFNAVIYGFMHRSSQIKAAPAK